MSISDIRNYIIISTN